MANNIAKIGDYFGYTLLEDSGETDDSFDQFAFDIEKQILRGDGQTDYGLLGDQVYIALIADLTDGVPNTAPYTTLVNGTTYIQTDGRNTLFIGIKKMLTYFVYSEYVKANLLYQSGVGSIQMLPKNATLAQRKEVVHQAHKRWNKGVDFFNREVYDYILFNQSDFTNWEFTKQSKFLTKGII